MPLTQTDEQATLGSLPGWLRGLVVVGMQYGLVGVIALGLVGLLAYTVFAYERDTNSKVTSGLSLLDTHIKHDDAMLSIERANCLSLSKLAKTDESKCVQ
jgi:hypothetical protein